MALWPPQKKGANVAKDRILTTHAGALPRSQDLRDLVTARTEGREHDAGALARLLREEVAAVVRRQVECGIDSVNDGELSKNNFTYYIRERMSGLEIRTYAAGQGPTPLSITARDSRRFPGYFAGRAGGRRAFNVSQAACVGPLKYVGEAALKVDVENFRGALKEVRANEA